MIKPEHFRNRVLQLLKIWIKNSRVLLQWAFSCSFHFSDSFRGTSRSQRARRSQKWSFRSPSMESRSLILKQKWVQLIFLLVCLFVSLSPACRERHKPSKYRLQITHTLFVLQDVQHNCQLHRISFCADDKTDKRIFTFICKDSESNKHLCYVFDSEKCVRVCSFIRTLNVPERRFRSIRESSVWTLLLTGGGDHSNHRAGLRLGLQEVSGVWRERRGDEEADRGAAEKSTAQVAIKAAPLCPNIDVFIN